MSTVLIAASEHLAALQRQTGLQGAEVFADTDALKALEAIARRRPQVIALEKPFAASARGAAFINRVKADPTLAACEIRIVEPGGAVGRSPAQRTTPVEAGATAAVVVEAPPAAAALDHTGTRHAPRVDVTRNIEVLIDGNPATLVDISADGAQVISTFSLRPNQRVRMSLIDAERPIRFNGVVAWATFEMPKEGPRYRAGVDFHDASPEALTRFIEAVTR